MSDRDARRREYRLGGLTCELARDHADIHQMGKCRWNEVES